MRGAGAEQLAALVRSSLESPVRPSPLHFFQALGLQVDYEFLRTGFLFHLSTPHSPTIKVVSISSFPHLHVVDEAVAVTPGLHLVEVVASATSENYTEVVGSLVAVAEQLTP